MHHRDSLGTDQWIEPGAVNRMVAGHGITHSERTDGATRQRPACLLRHPDLGRAARRITRTARRLSSTSRRGACRCWRARASTVRLILGDAWGERAPVETASEMFYADAVLEPGAAIPLPDDHEDRGVYVLRGRGRGRRARPSRPAGCWSSAPATGSR